MSTRWSRSFWSRKGFETLEEVAYVEVGRTDLAIEGFDEATAEELQARARESLDEINAEGDWKRAKRDWAFRTGPV